MSYYNWPKIVSELTDSELVKVINAYGIEPEEKIMASVYELKHRGIETDEYIKIIESSKQNALNFRKLYAGFWPRLGSLLLDFLFFLPITLIILFVNDFGKNFYYYTLLPDILIVLWYNIYLVKKYGGTPGKLVMGIKILKLNGQPVGGKEAILRHSVLFTLTIFGSIISIAALAGADTQYYNNLGWMDKQQYLAILSPVMFKIYLWVTNIWIYGELIVLLTNDKKRAVHDFIAGTIIVNTKYLDVMKNETAGIETSCNIAKVMQTGLI